MILDVLNELYSYSSYTNFLYSLNYLDLPLMLMI